MSQETDEIKAKSDIIELIGGYIKLIPAGANHRALCPFHNEKTPSMMISQSKQIWKCFGCGEGGDIFDFVMKIENVEFPEALKILAGKAGVTLKHSSQTQEKKDTRLYDVCDLVSRYWHQVYLSSSQAESVRKYLADRGLSPEIIEDFRIGYSIDSWDDSSKFLTKKKFNDQLIFLAGMTVKKDKGFGFYDRFRGRIMFPIIDLSGRVVGFGGRTMKSDDTAKYINSPQTPIYNKSVVLYGLYQAKEAIKENDLCILVEGYMDVIPSHQAGVKNVVAISGTALTIGQIKILKRYTSNIALALDMDSAGRQAAERSIEIALGQEMNVRMIDLPSGKDPGECIANNPDQWRQAIGAGRPIMKYYFERVQEKHDINNPEDKKVIAKYLLEKILLLGSPVEQDYWLKELSNKLSVSETVLRELIAKIINKQDVKYSRENTTITKVDSQVSHYKDDYDKEKVLFSRLLAALYNYPENLGKLIDTLRLEYLHNSFIFALYKELILFYTKNTDLISKIDVDKSKESSSDSDFDLLDLLKSWFDRKELVAEIDFLNQSYLLGQNDFGDLTSREIRSEIDDIVRTLKENYLTSTINNLKTELEQAEKSGDNKLVEKIYSQLNDLILQKN